MSPGINRDMGPCSVLWNSTFELNPTFGDVRFKDEITYSEVKEDGHGIAPIDAVPTGRLVELAFPMTRSNLTQLETAIKGSVKDLVASNLKVSNPIGRAVMQDAKPVIVKPLENNAPTSTTDEWLHMHWAYPFSNLVWIYNPAGQRVTKIRMIAFPVPPGGGGGGLLPGHIWGIGPLEAPTPEAPTLLTATKAAPPLAHMAIDLTWVDNAHDEIGFKIERSLTGGGVGFSQIDTVLADVEAYQDIPLPPLTWFFYRVRAYNAYGNSAYSNEAGAKTDAPF